MNNKKSVRDEALKNGRGATAKQLETMCESPRNAYVKSRREADQIARLVKRFKKEFPDANVLHLMHAERAFKAHVYLQRLEDCRMFFDGSLTGTEKQDAFFLSLEPEERDQKFRELERFGNFYYKQLVDSSKLLLAEKITLSVGDDLSDFILDESLKKQISETQKSER